MMLEEAEDEDNVFASTEEMMQEISLLTPSSSQVPPPSDQTPSSVLQQHGRLRSEINDNDHTMIISNPSNASQIYYTQQHLPSSRLLRWYQQLTIIQLTGGDSATTATDIDVDVMIAIMCQDYEKLQLQFSTLLELLVVETSNEDDHEHTTNTSCVSSQMYDHQNKTYMAGNDTNQATEFTMKSSLDPLSIFVQEEDEKNIRERTIRENYERDKKKKKQKAPNRNNNNNTFIPDEPQDINDDPSYIRNNAIAYLQLIQKDLSRLPSPHAPFSITTTLTTTTTTTLPSTAVVVRSQNNNNNMDRIRQLQSLLYLFAITHPNAGYIQGMHEIASYCLYVVEIEMVHKTSSILHSRNNNNNNNNSANEALAYWFTEQILMSLYIAYDVPPITTASNIENPVSTIQHPRTLQNANQLLQMSNRILQCFVLIDPPLYTILQQSSSSIPYQLIFTKWIRLLFGRDITAATQSSSSASASPSPDVVVDPHTYHRHTSSHPILSHADTVIYLWDALLEASYRLSQKQQLQQQSQWPGHTVQPLNTAISPLQVVAEHFCVARLWHHKYTIEYLQQHSSATHNNYLLHWLMNVPPEPMIQLQYIIHRMNYIIDHQYDNIIAQQGSVSQSSDYILPPFHPIPNEIYDLTPQQQSLQTTSFSSPPMQQSSSSQFHPLWDNSPFRSKETQSQNNPTDVVTSFLHTAATAFAGATSSSSTSLDPLPGTSLSALAESITSKTQSIQKVLVKEWEHVRAQLQHDLLPEEQSVDLFGTNRTSTNSENNNMYNLDYYDNR